MPRKTNSGWDFGELFPAKSVRTVLTVSELTSKVKGLLEGQFGDVWVSGEVTNFRLQSSGHAYFGLKDAGAQLSCVLFRGVQVPVADRAAVKDGQKVELRGELSVYEPRGQYQLIVRAVEIQGIGALQAAFEKLKARLAAEGLFDTGRKRPIPRFPIRIGLVTSGTGAALQDVLHVMGRRYAGIDLVLAPCRVQGSGADREIAEALARLNAWSESPHGEKIDVIVVTRGGGSLEDLWAFNEEAVARAIQRSAIPVVSAVGHEIDFTIADFVADARAATPSAAAELLTGGYVECRDRVGRWAAWLGRRIRSECEGLRETVASLEGRLRRAHPRRRWNEQAQHLDELVTALERRGREAVENRALVFEHLERRLRGIRPSLRFLREQERLERARVALSEALRRGWDGLQQRLARSAMRLDLLSPTRVLSRGYSITLDASTGQVLRSAVGLAPGARLRTRLNDGDVDSIVTRAARESESEPGREDVQHDSTH